jgi:integrase
MLLWMGARPEEVAQLLVSDFTIDPATERLMVSITDDGDHPAKERRSLKTAKKGTGRRIFPVPLELIRIGLPAYLEALRAASEAALFPELTTVTSRGLNTKWGEWWSSYLRQHQALPPSGHKAARDFRHTWTTAARASGIGEREREYIQGHSPANSSANVGYGSRQVEGLAIEQLEFKGLDLSHLSWLAPKAS